MRITVTTPSDEIFNLDVSEDLELDNFKAFCEVESGIPASDIVIVFQGRALSHGLDSLKSHGLADGDVVLIQRKASRSSGAASTPAAGKFNNLLVA